MELTVQVAANVPVQPITEYLQNELLLPRKVRHFLRTRRNVLVNGVSQPFHTLLQPGDTLQLTFLASDYPEAHILLGNAALVHVLYEDRDILIVNKPVGIKTHPNAPQENETMLNHVAAYLAGQQQAPYVVHRLDQETSGALLFAKNPVVLPILGRLLAEKKVYRTYQAQVVGNVAKKEFVIDAPLGRHRHDRRKRVVDEKNGQSARTHVTVCYHTPHESGLMLQLETGRTHQIRVHLASIQHPIIGDPLYNPHAKSGERLALHAVALDLTHPFTQEKIHVEALPSLF
ncbi:RluA family pseudouridine synthase [Enterococcus nangangensis]|uniref:RluA family pseudouridine synthase n=1 Tax=Enterococcus nangangensis TaxID=2559926 RepID=UPI0010F4CFF4|nr:RluA family pseudouridine synthase [Enterococcus nangangensis]